MPSDLNASCFDTCFVALPRSTQVSPPPKVIQMRQQTSDASSRCQTLKTMNAKSYDTKNCHVTTAETQHPRGCDSYNYRLRFKMHISSEAIFPFLTIGVPCNQHAATPYNGNLPNVRKPLFRPGRETRSEGNFNHGHTSSRAHALTDVRNPTLSHTRTHTDACS